MQSHLNNFKRFWVQQLATLDCDPGIYALKYLVQRQELNTEQQYWLCWLYANTYNVATAWVIFNEFPDYENVDQERLATFDLANRGRLPYQKDQKWLRGQLAPVYASLRETCGPRLGKHWFTFQGNYTGAWRSAMGIYKVGRYTAWMFLQAINEVCELELTPTSLELGHDSSQMHRGGLALALGHPEWAEKSHDFMPSELEELEAGAWAILQEVNERFEFNTVHADYFSMETSLCAFRKLFRREKGRYLGYYLDRWAKDINDVAAQDWPGINWDLLWECRAEGLHPLLNRGEGVIHKEHFGLYLGTGEFLPESPLRDKLNQFYHDH